MGRRSFLSQLPGWVFLVSEVSALPGSSPKRVEGRELVWGLGEIQKELEIPLPGAQNPLPSQIWCLRPTYPLPGSSPSACILLVFIPGQ